MNTIQKAEHQVKTLRFQVGEWKRKFVERAEQAVVDFKEKGKDALAKNPIVSAYGDAVDGSED